MHRTLLTEKRAKIAISALAAATTLSVVFFMLDAKASPAQTEYRTGAEYLAQQQQQLDEELALSSQLEALETELKAAREENAALASQNEELNQASVNLVDSLKLEYVGEYYATAYCCEVYPHICGGNGVTASGTVPTPGITCAADWNVLPPGTWLYIEGVGLRRVEDSGSAIKGKRLDIAIDTHQNALRWAGQGNHHTWVLNFEDGEA